MSTGARQQGDRHQQRRGGEQIAAHRWLRGAPGYLLTSAGLQKLA